jgi:sugar phosphate isomerase/epimerase
MSKSAVILLSFLAIASAFNSCDINKPVKLDMDNYYAWCIVPYDSKNRTPEQRIEMLKELGFKSYAYDWRTEHLPEMVDEFKLAIENDIQVNGVWLKVEENDKVGILSAQNKKVLQAIKEASLKTQIWTSLEDNFFKNLSEEESFDKAVEMISYLSSEMAKMGGGVGLYNHGGWFGNPDNLVKIVKSVPSKNVGIVFSFHNAHEFLDTYSRMAKSMAPYLWAVNLNGMNPDAPEFLQIGKGTEEARMIKVLEEAGYKGPYGILGHRMDADAKSVLAGNLEGLKIIFDND